MCKDGKPHCAIFGIDQNLNTTGVVAQDYAFIKFTKQIIGKDVTLNGNVISYYA